MSLTWSYSKTEPIIINDYELETRTQRFVYVSKENHVVFSFTGKENYDEVFHAMCRVYNSALQRGIELGREQKISELKKALDL